MKRCVAALLAVLVLTGCGSKSSSIVFSKKSGTTEIIAPETAEIPYSSRFRSVTDITLSDKGIQIKPTDSAAVFTSRDILFYEDKDAYDSGNPYGEGTDRERHSAKEAEAHTVINITKPGAYRVSGKLSAGQIRIDLGADSYADKDAVVELILKDADITCTVAPAIVFLNTYECDGNRSAETAGPTIDTSAAGANLILEGSNRVTGSHVAKIFKDQAGEQKLWKQDGAIYSYMSMNVYGPGSLDLNADNEGLDTELHLTINGGNISICSGNDGINTNQDGVSVTTINAGSLRIFAGLDQEGDGIDSNGYLVINGGSVFSAANPAADAGLDSDLGSYIHGGTVIALGAPMNWAESDSKQVTINLQFDQAQKAGSGITILREGGTESISLETKNDYARSFTGLILSHPALTQGETYNIYINGQQMAYTGTDAGFGPGGMNPGGRPPQNGEMPEGAEQPDNRTPDPFSGSDAQGGIALRTLSSRSQSPSGSPGNRMPPGFSSDDSSENTQSPGIFGPGQFPGGGMFGGFGPGQLPGGQIPGGPDSSRDDENSDQSQGSEMPDQSQGSNRPGIFGPGWFPGGQMPGNSNQPQNGQMPGSSDQPQSGQMPGSSDQPQNGQMPGNFGPGQYPGDSSQQNGAEGTVQTGFYMKDMVNMFTGVRAV